METCVLPDGTEKQGAEGGIRNLDCASHAPRSCLMEPSSYTVRAKVYFLTLEEGGRSCPVPTLDPANEPYFVLADLGLGDTEDGYPIRSMVRVDPEGGPGYIELGVEQTVRIMMNRIEGVAVQPGLSFNLEEGPNLVARATVVSVLE